RRGRRIRFDFLKGVRQCFAEICGLRLRGYAQSVFLLVIAEAAPGSRVLRENNRPLIFVRNGVQAISPRRERFSFDAHVVGKSDDRILVRARAPYFSVRHRLAPNLPPANFRPVIDNRDIRQPNPLRHCPSLAEARNVQLRRLASVLKLRPCIPRQNTQSHQQAKTTLPHVAHNHTFSSPPKTTIRMSSFFSLADYPTGDRRPLRKGVSRDPCRGTGELCVFRLKCFSSVRPVAQRFRLSAGSGV